MRASRSGGGTWGALGAVVLGVMVFGLALMVRGGPSGEAGLPTPSASGSFATSSLGSSAPPSGSPSFPPSAPPAGLPPGLVDKTWVTHDPITYGGPYVAGTLDGRYHLILPVGEHGATAADGRVVSVAFPPGAVCRGSTLIVRDLRQGGAKLLELSRPDAVGYAVLRGDTLYFAGSCGTDGIPGVYAASLVDGSVRTLIAPAPFPSDLGEPGGRASLELSPSGATLGSGICALGGVCTIQVLDLASGRLSQPLTGTRSALWLLTDSILVTVDTVDVYGYDMAGRLRWALTNKMATNGGGYLTSDGRQLIVLYEDQNPGEHFASIALASVDLLSGAERVLFRWPRDVVAPFLWVDASSDAVAVLIPGGIPPEEALDRGGGSFRADLFDLQSGSLAPGALLVSER